MRAELTRFLGYLDTLLRPRLTILAISAARHSGNARRPGWHIICEGTRRGVHAMSRAMNPATPNAARRPLAPSIDRSRRNYRHIRVLRWTFHRDEGEWVVCELALTGEDREYELRVPAEWNPTGRQVERFDDAMTAFQRHAMIERQLLDAGWVLDGFESEKVTVH